MCLSPANARTAEIRNAATGTKVLGGSAMTTLSSSQSDSFSNEGQLAFLSRVAHDDRFRAELEADPQAALAQYGLDVDPSQIPSEVTLPSEEAIEGYLSYRADSLLDMLSRYWVGFIGN